MHEAKAADLVQRDAGGITYDVENLRKAECLAEIVCSMFAHWGGVDILVKVVDDSSARSGSFTVLDNAHWLVELNQNLTPLACGSTARCCLWCLREV